MRTAILLLLAAVPAAANAQTYYLDIINTAPNSIVSFAAAPAGTQQFRNIVLSDRPVYGGGDSATVSFDKAEGGCLRDLRLTFADDRVLLQKAFNVCKFSSYHTGRYWRAMSQYPVVASKP